MARKEKDHDKKEEEEQEEEPKINDDEEGGDNETSTKKKRRKRKRKRSKKNDDDDENKDQDGGEDEPSNQEDDTNRTVFVEGVPYDSSPEQVAECLLQYCSSTLQQRSEIVDLRFPTWQDSGRMRGYGHVVFTTKEIMESVLKISSTTKLWMGRRYITLQRAKPKSNNGLLQSHNVGSGGTSTTSSNASKTLLIKNLSYEATEDDIQKVMEQFGTIVDGGIRIARNFSTRQSKGFAYIEYESLESAKKAIEKQQQQQRSNSKPICILKRGCILDYDEGRMKGSYKTASGRLWSREYKNDNNNNSNNKKSRTY